MANDVSTYFETLILPSAAMIQAPTQFRNAMLGKIYIPPEPVTGRPKQTVNVNIPVVSEGDVIDIGSGPIQITDQDADSVSLTVNNNKSWARVIRDFDGVRSPADFYATYLGVGIEAVTRKVNRSVCALVTTANFSTHSSITGGADTYTRTHVATGWGNLAGHGVPMTPGDLFFVTSHVPYANMLAETTLTSEGVVGINAAEMVLQTARFMPAFGMTLDYDQQFVQPSAGATYAALAFHRHAIAMIPVVPPSEQKPHVRETTYQVPGTGVVYRIQFWYDPREQGWVLHIHCCYALAVTRAGFGSYLVTT
jgi:uncharacterized RmlC-like cupin family protein